MPILHLWSLYTPAEEQDRLRHARAQATWEKLPWLAVPVAEFALPRRFECSGKKLPFIRDLFDHACDSEDDEAIIVFSNADIGFATDACLRIALALQPNDAGYAARRDFAGLVTAPTDDQIGTGADYPGTDVFFFRAVWWRTCRGDFPDMVLGREAWDACLRVLIEATNDAKPLSLSNLCWHERHGGQAYWEDPRYRYIIPGQRHNLALARSFMVRAGKNPAEFGIR